MNQIVKKNNSDITLKLRDHIKIIQLYEYDLYAFVLSNFIRCKKKIK